MKLQRKSIVALLLLVLAFNLTATVLPIQALDPGTGKFLTIAIAGEGYVIATKVKSGESWNFSLAYPSMTEKVGAGTVLLEPFAAEGYRFVEWIGDVNPDNTYKTEKYGNITAVFEELTHTITASAGPEGFIFPEGPQIVTHGADITFTFYPSDPKYHVSTIVVDDDRLGGFPTTYTFEDVVEDHTIHAVFDLIGQVSVPAGPGGSFNVDLNAILTTIGSVTTGGVILGSSVIDEVLPGTAIRLYVIEFGTVGASGGIVLAFLVPDGIDPYGLIIVKGPSWQAIYCDVNYDLEVNGDDVSDVANYIKSTSPNPPPYNPLYDVNGDGDLNEEDIHFVNDYKGTTLKEVTGPVVGDYITTIPLFDNPGFRVGR